MTITCPECDSRFKVDAAMVGKKAKCGGCEHVFVVPGEPESPATTLAEGAAHAAGPQELTWSSLYLAGIAAALLLFRGGLGGLGGMIATLVLALAVESAAVFLAFRGWRDAQAALQQRPGTHLARTGWLVNGILLGLVALSALLTLYQLIAGPSGGGGLPGLGDLQKIIQGYKLQ
jgi:predicted Zn finger-like uncharacterized protein